MSSTNATANATAATAADTISPPPAGAAVSSPTPLLSMHAGLIRPAGLTSPPAHPPSSPMPLHYQSTEEPIRDNTDSTPRAIQVALQLESVTLTSATAVAAAAAAAASGENANSARPRTLSTSASQRKSFTNGVAKKFKIYYCMEMASVAQALVKLDERFVLAEIQWDKFADGFPNLFIREAQNVKNYHVCFLANFHSPAVFFEQFSVITALPKLLPKSFKLFLPFFPTGTMERVSRLGEVATANTLARILSTIPVCSKGPAQVCIYDIHALQSQFYFKDTVLIRLGTCVNLLLERIATLEDRENVNIAFPDDGAAKRFGDLFPSYPHKIICHKVREGERRVVQLKEGQVEGKHCIIVDDLVQSGGTLLECARELLSKKASCVSAYVTHAIFPKESYKKFLKENCPGGTCCFQYFWCTDSNPQVADQLRGREPFEVLSIAPNIREVILDEERSA